MFQPINTILGSHKEEELFSYTITYSGVDILTGLPFNVPVILTEIDILPNTINIENNTISGKFHDSFEQDINYLTRNKNYNTVKKFSDVQNLDEVIAFFPSMVISRTFNILATAATETQIYQLIVLNDWTSGRNALVSLIKGS